ncbi:hypothetical protein [Caldisericum exile]|uniref:Uncharacterized protein n=1 Tax=Caldisericum exile (strain DSM 21853 / NBRC 104410 / AZM16c01) TaxID=511051 RepID=A0A7U6JFJ3_CALEA|nr:hypothetical protein [Caldisericum exile]BAL80210.1 hypothetical protein CSE_00840 [Caldisericum exile AZM16c01]
MKKIKLILVVLVLTLLFTNAGGLNVKAYDDQQAYIERYNLNHIQYLLNEAFNKAVLLNKNSTSTKPSVSPDGGSFYTERFDHYVFGNGYKQLRGYLINYVVARGGPQMIEVSTDYLRSYTGSIQVNGEVTTELKNAIIGAIQAKLGVATTWQTTAQSNIHIGSTAQVLAETDTYTLSM